jgi:hypothetical protein
MKMELTGNRRTFLKHAGILGGANYYYIAYVKLFLQSFMYP